MQQILVDIGGRPGIDCRGFCCYCYYRHVRYTPILGCRHCPPNKIGCHYCSNIFRKTDQKFKSQWSVIVKTLTHLLKIGKEDTRVYITGGGDPSCYPKLPRFIDLISNMGVPFAIGYTTGKGFDDPSIGPFLVRRGLSAIVFSIFSVNPTLLRKYVHDPSPDVTLSVLEHLCGEIEVYPNIIVVPGVNDGNYLLETCDWLEEIGAKGLILFRFANVKEQGLIRGNAPLIEGQPTQTIEEFNTLIADLSRQYKLRIDSMPFWDPIARSPFIILHEPQFLSQLPRVIRRASVITGQIAAPYLRKILEFSGAGTTTVVTANKDISCLITSDDLQNLDLSLLERTVVIPGRALVHDTVAEFLLSRDGTPRKVVRGPEALTIDQKYWHTSRNDELQIELISLTELINTINTFGE